MKLFLIALGLAIISIVRFIVRFIKKKSQGNSITSIKTNPGLASSYADGLDFPYSTKKCDATTFGMIRAKILSASSIGKYKVLYAVDAGENRILVFTELSYSAVGLMPSGKVTDVADKAFHDFAVVFNISKSELQIFSSGFSDSTSKFQKQELLKAILEMDVTKA